MAKLLTWGLTGLLAVLLAGCGGVPRPQAKQAESKPGKGQVCRFERGNCQTILIVDDLPEGSVGAR